MSDVASHPPAQHGQPAPPGTDPTQADASSPGLRLPVWVRLWTKGRRMAASRRAAVITHWASQILPPMLLLLAFSSYGPALWFTLMIPMSCTFFSIVFLPSKLTRLKQHRRYLLRPVLTITITAAMIGIAKWSYSIAERQFESSVRIIDVLCKVQGTCPESLPGWQKTREGVYQLEAGRFVMYPIYLYLEGGRGFRLHLIKSLDLGRYYTNVKDSPEVGSASGTATSTPATAPNCK